MPIITLSEGQPLEIPANLNRNTVINKLLRFSNSLPFQLFTQSKGIIKATGVVGSICYRNLQIEILPKVSSGSHPEDDRKFLLNLLRYSGHLSNFHAFSGKVSRANGQLLEAMITEVANELLRGLREGTPRRYEIQREESPTIRGRIEFHRLAIRLPSKQALLPIKHAPLTSQNLLSQVLKWTALKLFRHTRSFHNREVLARAINQLSDIDLKSFTPQDIHRFPLSRFEMRWSHTLTIAKMIASESSFDPTSSGKENAFSMLFPLNYLFEKSMIRLLNSCLTDSKLHASNRSDTNYLLENTDTGEKSIRIRPDFIFADSDKNVVAIGDAKWKKLKNAKRSHDVVPTDIYQLLTYMSQYNVNTGILFFPRAEWMSTTSDKGWFCSYNVPMTEKKIHLIGVDMQKILSSDKHRREEALNCLKKSLDDFIEKT